MSDLVRTGLASVAPGDGAWNTQAARLVDAQAPGPRRARAPARRAAAHGSGMGRSPRRRARPAGAAGAGDAAAGGAGGAAGGGRARRGGLDAGARRSRGDGEHVSDEWAITGQIVEDDERFRVQRSWLRGLHSNRDALVLQFAAGPARFPEALFAGAVLDAELAFWPSAHPLRALVHERRGEMPALAFASGGARRHRRAAGRLRARARPPALARSHSGRPRRRRSRARRRSGGRTLPGHRRRRARARCSRAAVTGSCSPLSGGHPIDVYGEWDGRALLAAGRLRRRRLPRAGQRGADGVKPLVEAALVGLGRTAAPAADPGDAGDSLLARAADAGAERAFLFRLGVHAVRARAGVVPAAATRTPGRGAARCASALPARRWQRSSPICAPAGASRSWRRRWNASTRAGGVCPRSSPRRWPRCATPPCSRRRRTWQASAVAGWRGTTRRGAGWSTAWRRIRWSNAAASGTKAAPDARLAALRATRVTDPAEARDWVAVVVEGREGVDCAKTWSPRWPPGCPPTTSRLLAQALADRAAGVRQAAARLLARIETSPLAARARERADAVLAYAPPATGVLGALKSRLAGKGSGELSVSPPAAFVAAWADDGLRREAAAGDGQARLLADADPVVCRRPRTGSSASAPAPTRW